MSEPNARPPIRLEDFKEGLAWLILLKLPGLSLRPVRLLVAYLGAIPLYVMWRNSVPPVTVLFERFTAWQIWLLNLLVGRPQSYSSLQALMPLARAKVETTSLTYWLLAGVVGVILGGLFAMLARSTALEVARDIRLSLRSMFAWLIRRWRSALLWLWPVPVALLFKLLAWAFASGADQAGPTGWLTIPMLAFALVLTVIGVLFSIFAFSAAAMTPAAAASDDGDDFDAIQRTFAITLAYPLRTLLCFAWVAAIAGLLSLFVQRLILTALLETLKGRPELSIVHNSALAPLQILPIALALSVIGSGLTLSYLYLRRIADEQDISEVPIQG